jgi:hypothetical protein
MGMTEEARANLGSVTRFKNNMTDEQRLQAASVQASLAGVESLDYVCELLSHIVDKLEDEEGRRDNIRRSGALE